MSNEVQSIDSLFNADLGGVETAFPLLEAGSVPCIIAAMTQGETKEKKSPVLNIKLTTAVPWKTTKGETKNAGFPLLDMVSLTTTHAEDGSVKYSPLQRLAQIKEAVFGDKSGPFGSPAMYVGKPVTVRIKIETNAEFGDRNRVQAYVKVVN